MSSVATSHRQQANYIIQECFWWLSLLCLGLSLYGPTPGSRMGFIYASAACICVFGVMYVRKQVKKYF